MGSTDSLGTLATSKDLESICSGSSVLGLPGSGPSPRVGLNKENSSSRLSGSSPLSEVWMNKKNSSPQVAVSEENLNKREGQNQASPSAREEKLVAGKKKIEAAKPRFKRKINCISSSQPVCGAEFDLGKETSWEIECKKQVQIAKKFRLRAERAEDKLQKVRSLLIKVLDNVTK